MKRCIVVSIFTIVYLFTVFMPVSHAHMYDEGYSYAYIDQNKVRFELLLPFEVLWQYDLNGDYNITIEELAQQREQISDYMESHIELFNGIEKMEFALIDMEPTLMESTDAYIVQFHFEYTSSVNVEDLTIRYRAILADIEPIHHNYIQLYKEDIMVAHRVVFKEMDTFQYKPGGQPLFTAALLGQYLLLGVQSMIQSIWHLLFVLAVLLGSAGKLKPALENAAVFAGANMIGMIAIDRLAVELGGIWIYLPLTAAMVYLVYAGLSRRWWGLTRPVCIGAGLLHGMLSLTALKEIGVYREFKIVTMAAYDMGILLALLGVVYVAANLWTMLQKKETAQ